jgi:hypothetical protein
MIWVSRGHTTYFLISMVHMHSRQRSFETMTGACGPYYLGGSATCGALEGGERSEAASPANNEAPQWPWGYANS